MRWLFGLCLVAAFAGEAKAGTPYPVKMKCPVGGKSFTHLDTMSYTTWGERPDGRPYGSWTFPTPLPVCPDNGLVIYREYSRDEVSKLKALIAAPEYRALVAQDTDYYRAAWLARSLEPAGDETAHWLLLRASWQVDDRPDLKRRYQTEFAEAVERAPARPQELSWIALQARRANSLRELGRFDDATAVLKSVTRHGREVVLAPEPAGNVELTKAEADARREAESRHHWNKYLARMETLIARRDSSSEPLDAIPPRVAAGFCMEAEKTGRAIPEACEDSEVQAMIAEIKAYDQD